MRLLNWFWAQKTTMEFAVMVEIFSTHDDIYNSMELAIKKLGLIGKFEFKVIEIVLKSAKICN